MVTTVLAGMEEALKEERQNDIPETAFPKGGLIILTGTVTGDKTQVTAILTMAEGIMMVEIKTVIRAIGITDAEMIMQLLLLIIKTGENKTTLTARAAGKPVKPIQLIMEKPETIHAEEI